MWLEPRPAGGALLPGYRRIASRIVYRDRRIPPDLLWFDVPERLQAELSDTGNFWLLALLPLAFHMGEPLQISAPVDPMVVQNAQEIMRTWTRLWFPELKPVAIEAAAMRETSRVNRGRTGLFFTGGVDSFFSVFHYDETAKSNEEAQAPVDDLIYVCGFDIPLAKRAAWERKAAGLEKVARALNKGLVILISNLRETRLGSLPWDTVTHGPALAAAGLLLEPRFGTLLLSAGGSGLNHRTVWGSHPLTDPLFSTSRTEFIRYANGAGRFLKTAFISRFDVALQNLHVCWEDASERNCGQCEKCYRTLVGLELLGVREKASSFPRGGFSLKKLESMQLKNRATTVLMSELKVPALERGRHDIVHSLDRCLAYSRRTHGSPGAVLRRLKERWRTIRKSFWSRMAFWLGPESQAPL